ncbi:hypothetical protein BKA80DRAFT_284982 [Phyllosticta citrichinensis]
MSIALTTTISQQPLRAPTTIRGVPGVRHGQVVLFGGFSSCPTADPQGQAMVPAAAMLAARPLAKFWLHTPVMHMRVIWLHDPHGTDVGELGRGVVEREVEDCRPEAEECQSLAKREGGPSRERLGMVFVSRAGLPEQWRHRLGLGVVINLSAMAVFQSLWATSREDQRAPLSARRVAPVLAVGRRDGRCG